MSCVGRSALPKCLSVRCLPTAGLTRPPILRLLSGLRFAFSTICASGALVCVRLASVGSSLIFLSLIFCTFFFTLGVVPSLACVRTGRKTAIGRLVAR